MASTTKKKPVAALLITGAMSAVLYVALFTNQDFVSSVFTQGGVYAFLPIGTALLFSFVHGSFTGHFWTVLGVEAKKKKEVK